LVKCGGCVVDRGSRAGMLSIMYRFAIDLGFLTGLRSPPGSAELWKLRAREALK
jgi:hypothetical protein